MVNLGLIGRNLGHSWSADYFASKFLKEGIKGTYNLYPLRHLDELPQLLRANPDIIGLNITIPYKQEIIRYLDSMSEDAAKIGAVNVVKILRKEKSDAEMSKSSEDVMLIGFNSDWKGFKESLLHLISSEMKSALVLGTGGASKAVQYALSSLDITPVLVSRHKAKGTLTYDQVNKEVIKDNKLIINTTPLGMYPYVLDYPDIPYDFLTHDHLCYDLIYNPEKTKFLSLCEEQGAKIKNGLEMLHLQADISWKIWTGK